jgi:hypothetical protein
VDIIGTNILKDLAASIFRFLSFLSLLFLTLVPYFRLVSVALFRTLASSLFVASSSLPSIIASLHFMALSSCGSMQVDFPEVLATI